MKDLRKIGLPDNRTFSASANYESFRDISVLPVAIANKIIVVVRQPHQAFVKLATSLRTAKKLCFILSRRSTQVNELPSQFPICFLRHTIRIAPQPRFRVYKAGFRPWYISPF